MKVQVEEKRQRETEMKQEGIRSSDDRTVCQKYNHLIGHKKALKVNVQ